MVASPFLGLLAALEVVLSLQFGHEGVIGDKLGFGWQSQRYRWRNARPLPCLLSSHVQRNGLYACLSVELWSL